MIKYKYSDLDSIVRTFDMFTSQYSIISSVEMSNEKLIYVVQDKKENIKYVLKFIPRQSVKDIQLSIFKQLQSLKIHNVYTIQSIDYINDFLVIKYDYIQGQTLDKYFKHNTFSKSQFIDLQLKLVKTINELHKNNIYHNDINCKNILIHNNEPYFIDFDNASKKPINTISDVSSLALSIYIALLHDSCYNKYQNNSSLYQLVINIINCDMNKNCKKHNYCSKENTNLLYNMIINKLTNDDVINKLKKMIR